MREAAREAETGGADSVGAQVHVAEPWAGYDEMRLDEVLARLQGATEVELAVVRRLRARARGAPGDPPRRRRARLGASPDTTPPATGRPVRPAPPRRALIALS